MHWYLSFSTLAKQFGMRAETYQINIIRLFIYPNKKEITLNMAFHTTCIIIDE